MRKQLTVMAMALAFGGAGCGNNADEEVFDAVLSSANEVPARSSGASGRAGLVFNGTEVSFSIEVDDVNNITQAHIHSGPAGVNGPVRVFLFPTPPASSASTTPFSTQDRTILSSGSFLASDVGGVTFEQLLAEMRAGNAYVNVHTRTFPGGEIRGQIRLVPNN